jgi:hypothetical protein
MTITVTPIQNNQTFGAWLSTTNRLVNIISQNTVTTDASTGGSLTTGNAYVNGFFGASYVYADQGLIGGNVSSNGTLNLIANAAFRYSTSNLMTVTANSTNSNVALRADNTAIIGNTLFINATINAVSSANLAGAVSISNTLSVSNAATFSDVMNVEDIIPLVDATFDLGSITNSFDNAFIRTVQFSTGSVNGTNYTGTAANATNLNSQPGSFYTNATNITAGTLATARLPATVNVTTINTQTVNTVTLIANNSAGTLGQTLLSNGTGIYWGSAATVTSVGSANGLTGGPITSSGSLSVVQGTGTVVNSTGVHVNSSYIGTLTANNSTNLGNQPASFYTNATNITAGTLATARLPATVNVATINVNAATVSNTLTINGNATFNQTALTQSLIPTANVTYSLGNSTNRYATAFISTVQLSDGNSISSGTFSGTSNNATNLNGQPASFYTNGTNISTGTVAAARLPAGTTSAVGVVQLVDSVSNTSVTIAATANSVKTVYDFAAQIAATGTPPSGANTNVQFNNSNAFGGSAGFTFNSVTSTVTVSNTIIANLAFNAGANVVVNTTSVGIGNSTVNTVIAAGSLALNGVNVNTAITGNAATAYTNAIAIAANATNLTSGTISAARLTGTYAITANNANNLNGQPASFYTNASNITTGTIPTDRLPATSNISTRLNVGANVSLSTVGLTIGNSTVNTTITAGSFTTNGANNITLGTTLYVVANGNIGISNSSPNSKLTVNGSIDLISGSYRSGIIAANSNVDCSLGNYFTVTVDSAITFSFINVPTSRAYSFTLEVTHTAGAITWPTSVRWPSNSAPSFSTGTTHLFMFVTDNGGTRWRGASLTNYDN